MRTHLWIRASLRAARENGVENADLVGTSLVSSHTVDAHRRLRGPYTAMGSLCRDLFSVEPGAVPTLVRDHEIEVLTVAPELRASVEAVRETLTSLAVPQERTRFYSRYRTLRIAHGLTELVRDSVREGGGPRHLVVENAHHADQTDTEAISVMLRRLDPAEMQLVICTDDSELPDDLAQALERYAVVHEPADPTWTGGQGDLAEAYLAGDCTSDDPLLRSAYDAIDDRARAALHDRRLEQLRESTEFSWRLGAIPFHAEHGSDPAGVGADALREALDYCINTGFYEATVDFGKRGRAVIDWREQGEHWWAFTTKMTTSLAALSRAEEAEALYREARAFTIAPEIHLQAAYATAMLYTRHHEPTKVDDELAKGWIYQAIAFADLKTDPKQRAFEGVFQRNGLALIEAHMGNHAEALRLVDEGMARLDRELEPDEHTLHRSVLRYNRGQVYLALRRLDDALADYTAVMEIDPNYPEYHFDRGNLLRRMGRYDEALADYDRAIELSPPFPEVFYNRADLNLELGNMETGMADLDYVLELQPEYVDALVNRAGLRVAADDLDGAERDARAGLAVDPDNVLLQCVVAQVAAARGDVAAARTAYDAVIEADPQLQAAWAGRAVLAYGAGDFEHSVADMHEAVALGESAELLFNRAVVLKAMGRRDEAMADLDRALELAPDDPEVLAERQQLLHAVA
ncbi:tetratricopeptide repeat protein [Luteipulveratus mongoliensis]|uniref:Uncharacterized protein n=1 Tax=Luteipulveratus mongoliensis TaxID=571913 RepID=A0A0K1JNU8_9MICO|nr:tetratricopeptide repeat protein [Luteipulveratus mongoliensis]AKU18258.1 hypothetical protein VV02_24415 [Luteipulveratus mongoliensis]